MLCSCVTAPVLLYFYPFYREKGLTFFLSGSITEQGKYYPDAKTEARSGAIRGLYMERSVIMDSSDSHGRLWNGGTWMIWNAVVTLRKEL